MPVVAVLAALIVVAGIAFQAWDTYREYQQAGPGTADTTEPADPQPSPAGDEPSPPEDEEAERLTFPMSVDTGFEGEFEFKLRNETVSDGSIPVQEAIYEDKYLKSIYAHAHRGTGADELLQAIEVTEVRDVGEAQCGVTSIVEYRTCVVEKDGTAVAVYPILTEDSDEFLITFATIVADGLG